MRGGVEAEALARWDERRCSPHVASYSFRHSWPGHNGDADAPSFRTSSWNAMQLAVHGVEIRRDSFDTLISTYCDNTAIFGDMIFVLVHLEAPQWTTMVIIRGVAEQDACLTGGGQALSLYPSHRSFVPQDQFQADRVYFEGRLPACWTSELPNFHQSRSTLLRLCPHQITFTISTRQATVRMGGAGQTAVALRHLSHLIHVPQCHPCI